MQSFRLEPAWLTQRNSESTAPAAAAATAPAAATAAAAAATVSAVAAVAATTAAATTAAATPDIDWTLSFGALTVRSWSSLIKNVLSASTMPDALLIHAPISSDIVRKLTDHIQTKAQPIPYIQIVGLGVNASTCDPTALAKFFETNRAAGGTVDIVPASVTRTYRFPSDTPGRLGRRARQIWIWQMLSNIGGGNQRTPPLSQSLVVRIQTANVQTGALVITESGCTITRPNWNWGFRTSLEYCTWLEDHGHLKEKGPAFQDVFTTACITIGSLLEDDRVMESDVSTFIHTQLLQAMKPHHMSREQTMKNRLVILSAIKFAMIHALCGECDTIYRPGRGFAISAKNKMKTDFGDDVVYTAAVTLMRATLARAHNAPLSPMYDLIGDFRMEDWLLRNRTRMFSTSTCPSCRHVEKPTYDRRIREALRMSPARKVNLVRENKRPAWIVSLDDPFEEVDDEAAFQNRSRRLQGVRWDAYLTGGEVTPIQRLTSLLPFL